MEELITVDHKSTKLSESSSQFDEFLRRFEVLSPDLAITKNCKQSTNRESYSIRKKCDY